MLCWLDIRGCGYFIPEGVNGILPNLDLVHVVTHLSEMEGIPSALHVGVRFGA